MHGPFILDNVRRSASTGSVTGGPLTLETVSASKRVVESTEIVAADLILWPTRAHEIVSQAEGMTPMG